MCAHPIHSMILMEFFVNNYRNSFKKFKIELDV